MILEHFQIFSLFNEAFRPHFVSNLNFLYKNITLGPKRLNTTRVWYFNMYELVIWRQRYGTTVVSQYSRQKYLFLNFCFDFNINF